MSVDSWLAHANYPQWRKDELLATWVTVKDDYWKCVKKHNKVKAFTKEEFYNEYKAPRGIFSRTDAFKCMVGPLIHAIEEEVFKHPAFIKKIPVADRPKYIKELFEKYAGDVYGSDFSSYESSFKKQLMESCEFVMYDYMVQNHPEAKMIMEYFKKTISGMNHIQFKNTELEIEATRMSGEMNTSLGNGFTNLMVILYLAECKNVETHPVVEGDDALFKSTVLFTEEDYAEFGLICKLEKYNDFNEASFCGLIFDMINNVNIADPVKIILKTPWVKRQYIQAKHAVDMGLLKARALSMLWTYPGAPIIQNYAKYLLRMTYNYQANFGEFDRYRFEEYGDLSIMIDDNMKEKKYKYKTFLKQLFDTPYKNIKEETRFLMADVFKIPIDMQLRLERFFDNLNDLEPFTNEDIDYLSTDVQKDFYERHVFYDVEKADGKFNNHHLNNPIENFNYSRYVQMIQIYDLHINNLNNKPNKYIYKRLVSYRDEIGVANQ